MIIQRNLHYESGVSEAIGFLLMFTIVILGIGLVALYGLPMLLQQQSGADEKIMEKNMIVLQNDFKSIVYKTIPYKETSMKIASGALYVYKGGTTGPKFSIGSSSGGNEYLQPLDPFTPVPTGDLRYLSSQSQNQVSLQNGAVVMRDSSASGSVMLAQPRWFYDSATQTLVINIITVNSSSVMSREGIGTVQMELGQSPDYPTDYKYLTSTTTPALSSSTVYVTYTPDSGQDYSTAWEDYFVNTMKMDCSLTATTPPTLNCHTTASSPVSALVIKRTDIIIRSV